MVDYEHYLSSDDEDVSIDVDSDYYYDYTLQLGLTEFPSNRDTLKDELLHEITEELEDYIRVRNIAMPHDMIPIDCSFLWEIEECNICSYPFMNHAKCEAHRRSVHGERPVAESRPLSPANPHSI